MKIFLHFLTIMMVTAAPHGPHISEYCNLQRLILQEIIDSVFSFNSTPQISEIFINEVITPRNCTNKNFYMAGEVLSAYKAKDLRLKEKDWRLPRQLVAYTRNEKGKVNASPTDQVDLHTFLESIKECAQEHYRESCKNHKKSINK